MSCTQSILGGNLTVATYEDFGMPHGAPDADKLVFGLLESDNEFRLMAYDVPGQDAAGASALAGATRRENGVTVTDRSFFQSLRGSTLDEISRLWDGLADAAEIIEPLAASEWSPGFGMLTDRFGVTWVVDVQARRDR